MKTMNKIGYEERETVYRTAIEKWGSDAQSTMAVEEMSELTKELCKIKRGKNDVYALADEIADVRIMLEQLCIMYGVKDIVCKCMDMKIERLKKRINEEDKTNE